MANSQETWILNFHGIGDCCRAFDKGEDKVWVSESNFYSILDFADQHSGFEITFDDGNTSDAIVALPALIERGLKATFFIPAGKIGVEGFLTADQIRCLHDQGMEIGSHGWSHRSWRGISKVESRRELIDSREKLQEITESPVYSAACPFGDYDRKVLAQIKSAGYSCAYTSDRGPASKDHFLRSRNTVCSSDSPQYVIERRREFNGGLLDTLRRVVKRLR